jgi:hypothetical protein
MANQLSYQPENFHVRVAGVFINTATPKVVNESSPAELSALFKNTPLTFSPYDKSVVEFIKSKNPQITTLTQLYQHVHVLDRTNENKLSKGFISTLRALIREAVSHIRRNQRGTKRVKK